MAPAKSPRPTGQPVTAHVALLQLKNCLVNLPASLVSALVNANTVCEASISGRALANSDKVAQNIVVELSYRQPEPSSDATYASNTARSMYAGWTGMPSKRKLAPLVGRDGLGKSKGSLGGKDQELGTVEMDATFARSLGLAEGQKVIPIYEDGY